MSPFLPMKFIASQWLAIWVALSLMVKDDNDQESVELQITTIDPIEKMLRESGNGHLIDDTREALGIKKPERFTN